MRIISYNTRGSLGMDEVRSTPRIADTLRPLCADIICFQEIHKKLFWSGSEDQPSMLEHLLNRRFFFQCNVPFGMGEYGIGIATRLPVKEVHNHKLPGDKEQRGALELRFHNCADIGDVSVFCTHWGLSDEERKLQAEYLAEQIRLGPRPVIVCGDFNEGPTAPAVTLLKRLAKLSDMALDPQPTFPSNAPTERIDFIMESEGLRSLRFETVRSLASDHLPILADIVRE